MSYLALILLHPPKLHVSSPDMVAGKNRRLTHIQHCATLGSISCSYPVHVYVVRLGWFHTCITFGKKAGTKRLELECFSNGGNDLSKNFKLIHSSCTALLLLD